MNTKHKNIRDKIALSIAEHECNLSKQLDKYCIDVIYEDLMKKNIIIDIETILEVYKNFRRDYPEYYI
jgi:hypothetical protein